MGDADADGGDRLRGKGRWRGKREAGLSRRRQDLLAENEKKWGNNRGQSMVEESEGFSSFGQKRGEWLCVAFGSG